MNEMTGLIRCPQNTLCFFCQVLEVFTFGEGFCRLVISFFPETATTPKEKLPIVANDRNITGHVPGRDGCNRDKSLKLPRISVARTSAQNDWERSSQGSVASDASYNEDARPYRVPVA